MRRLAAVAVAAMLALAGCGSPAPDPSFSAGVGDISMIEVGPSDTRAPGLTWDRAREFTRAQSKVVWSGEGAALADGQPLLLDVYVVSLETGEVLANTYDGLPRSFLLAPELLGDDLYKLLKSQRVGARVLSVAPSTGDFEAETSIAVVIDVLSDRASGQPIGARDDLPIVLTDRSGEPNIVLGDAKDVPAELTVATLVQGAGEQIQVGSYIVCQYKAIYVTDGSDDDGSWRAGDVFNTTWPAEKAPFEIQIGEGKVIRGLDEGLVDQTAGSQVMIVVPESWGYPGKGTLIFVIDILDVWTPSP